jgi:hypothetical protein
VFVFNSVHFAGGVVSVSDKPGRERGTFAKRLELDEEGVAID